MIGKVNDLSLNLIIEVLNLYLLSFRGLNSVFSDKTTT